MAGASGASTGVGDLLDDLVAEQRELQERLRALDNDVWLRPTPARGWDVRDTVAHLADTDEMAIATATGTPGSINERITAAASGEDLTYQGVLRGRRRTGPEVLAWWETTTAAEREMFEGLDPNLRVPWGIGMLERGGNALRGPSARCCASCRPTPGCRGASGCAPRRS
jgi:uncharacterized protein (TIGR03083 family)